MWNEESTSTIDVSSWAFTEADLMKDVKVGE
jgi:hypothetical protein